MITTELVGYAGSSARTHVTTVESPGSLLGIFFGSVLICMVLEKILKP